MDEDISLPGVALNFFGKHLWKVLLSLGSLLALLTKFWRLEFLHDHPLRNAVFCLLLSVIIALVWTMLDLIEKHSHALTRVTVQDGLRSLIQRAYQAGRYLDVVRLGSDVSRFLWLSGSYRHRVAVGHLVEDAAAKLERPKEQIRALIDDLGWTYVELGDYGRAKANLENGIRKAEDADLPYWAAKGERHLAGLSARMGKDAEIDRHLTAALARARSIPDKTERDELLLSLELAFAEHELDSGDPAAALARLQNVTIDDTRDPDRYVKLYALLGNVYLELHQFQEAKDAFSRGYQQSQGLRADQHAKNAMGLAKVEMHHHRVQRAREYLDEARLISKELGAANELREADRLLSLIAEDRE